MEIGTYNIELLAQEFAVLNAVTALDRYDSYTLTLDMSNEEEVLLFFHTLIKIDGSIIRTSILEEDIVDKGCYLATIFILLPKDTGEEFINKTGIVLNPV